MATLCNPRGHTRSSSTRAPSPGGGVARHRRGAHGCRRPWAASYFFSTRTVPGQRRSRSRRCPPLPAVRREHPGPGRPLTAQRQAGPTPGIVLTRRPDLRAGQEAAHRAAFATWPDRVLDRVVDVPDVHVHSGGQPVAGHPERDELGLAGGSAVPARGVHRRSGLAGPCPAVVLGHGARSQGRVSSPAAAAGDGEGALVRHRVAPAVRRGLWRAADRGAPSWRRTWLRYALVFQGLDDVTVDAQRRQVVEGGLPAPGSRFLLTLRGGGHGSGAQDNEPARRMPYGRVSGSIGRH
jgi:hypothetical protein